MTETICVNGELVEREVTDKEIEEREKFEEWEKKHPPEPTTEEKIAELEKQVADLSATLVNQI